MQRELSFDEEERLLHPLIPSHPLFGFGNPLIGRAIYIIIIGVTSLFIFSTIISAFVAYHSAADIFFTLCILMICTSHLLIIYWYQQGTLDPKFRNLIYWNTLAIIFLCICALIYFHSRK